MYFPTPVSFSELDEEALVTGGAVMAFTFIFGGIALLQTFCEHHHVSVLREASIPILFGILIGFFTFFNYFDEGIHFDSKIFFFALLPIIVFKEGYSLNKQHFMKNIFYVILYGVFGTIFNFIILLALTYAVTQSTNFWYPPKGDTQIDDSFYAQMFFSACITSKDSAVSLSVLEFEHAPKLHSIIFGEQILNDVIVFALSKTTQRYNNPNDHITFGQWYNFLIFIALTLAQLLVGLLVGIVVGSFATWITKSARFISEHSSIVTAFTIYVAYFAFCLCEAFDFCGVMAVLICGIMMAHYQTYNLPKISSSSSKITIKALAYVSETIIYFYIGFAVTANEINNESPDSISIYPFVLLQYFAIQPTAKLLSMLLSHGLAYSFYGNRLQEKGPMRINRYEFLILFYAGLIKGVVAYALICEDQAGGKPYYFLINYCSLYLIIGTTVLIGGTLKYITEWSYEQMEVEHLKESSVDSHNKSGLKKTFIQEDVRAYEKQDPGKSQKWFKTLDEDYIKPLLIYKYYERKEDILKAKKLKKNKHNLEKIEEEEMKMYEDSVREQREHNHKSAEMHKKSKLTELDIDSDPNEDDSDDPPSQYAKQNQNHVH